MPSDNKIVNRFFAIVIFNLIIMLTVGLSIINAQGRDVRISFYPDIESMTIGDRGILTVEVNYPTGYQIIFPKLPTKWGQFEVLDQFRGHVKILSDGRSIVRQQIMVTSFMTGVLDSPNLIIKVVDETHSLSEYTAPSLSIEVVSVLPQNAQLRDIRTQRDLSLWIGWAVIPLSLVIICIVATPLYYFVRWVVYRRRNKEGEIDKRSPYEQFVAQLQHIDELGLLSSGNLKEHYTLVSDSVRRFLYQTYDFAALDLTTNELEGSLRTMPLVVERSDDLIRLLEDCDLVKFTEVRPEEESTRLITSRAKEIINAIIGTEYLSR